VFIHENSCTLAKSDFTSFVKTTFGYFSNKERILDNPSALINIVRMISVLPLEKNNFYVTDDYARKLSAIILRLISKHVSTIFEEMNESDWILFEDGLVILMSIEMLNDENLNMEYDSITLLTRIPTKDNKQKLIANTLFKKLMQLKLQINRDNWIDLLNFVDNNNLAFDCLDLATTFDHIRCCLERILPLYEIDDKIRNKMTTIFEHNVFNTNHLTCTLTK